MTNNAEATAADTHAAVDAGQATLIDVREAWEYDEEHIDGALLIPLAELPDRLAEVPTDRDVYLHCRTGGRSARAVDYLHAHGIPRAINVLGGIEAWTEAGLPVSRGVSLT